MRDVTNIICKQTVFELIAPDSTVSVNVELAYSVKDPFAVEASFRTGNAQPVVWVFARELLADGLSEASGDGDVTVAPIERDQVELVLTSPSGHARFHASASVLSDFLEHTYAAVPQGGEYSWLDFDAALTDLLEKTMD
ncbi:sporulation protein SsgA [Pseudonocardia sulfidoxydans NBRC 16205]|uniref:Sporulation protein SsgA n=1 Tax=Pseudonocardia sulfidoxydans NBRC 16205 TaxID=1223511 RepID=A0A511DEN3_9PSEU|nr:SsgA family sporulation/cell division regulator [Pseudonocardia sulfidoxydans]GEL22873.1 sporulation protein SsgA [Pseudonocardia sulfidoxydans NBRC 16205]